MDTNFVRTKTLNEVFVISAIIKVEVSVIIGAKVEAGNTYRDLDYLGYHKNLIIIVFFLF